MTKRNRHLTLEHAKALSPGDMLYHKTLCNADGSPQRFKVNGRPKTWKTRPEQVKIPVKRGLYEYDYVLESDLEDFTDDEEMAMAE